MTTASSNWGKVFDAYGVIEGVESHGFYDINSKQFKALGLEPRLLTKIDHSRQLPEVMKAAGLSILTLTNSSWRIGPFQIFEELPNWEPPDESVTVKSLPDWLVSLKGDSISGEGGLMNAASASGILSDFAGEELIGTISGRSRTGNFDFTVDNQGPGFSSIEVRSAQMEVDGGFEGLDSICLFEAKRHISLDFNLRQIYYPYRTYIEKVSKRVRPIFITFANDVFDIVEFEFENLTNLSSARQIKHQRFMLNAERVSMKELLDIAERSTKTELTLGGSSAPFPQADDFERVIEITEFIASKPRSIDDITESIQLSQRQSDYYFAAAKFLGLGEVVDGHDGRKFRLATSLGSRIVELPYAEKRKEFARLLLAIPAIRTLFNSYVNSGRLGDINEAERLVGQISTGQGISGKTIRRRAQTILAWTKWLINLTS